MSGARCQQLYQNPAIAHTAWKVSKYGVISGPYFPVFGLNTETYFVNLRFSPNTLKYEPEITLYFDTFHAVPVGVEVFHKLRWSRTIKKV